MGWLFQLEIKYWIAREVIEVDFKGDMNKLHCIVNPAVN